MGSEMCIRDSSNVLQQYVHIVREQIELLLVRKAGEVVHDLVELCLLYTSDAADERSSVDLGGRRIIKKKKQLNSEDHA
mgnify:CR=1 FL=1